MMTNTRLIILIFISLIMSLMVGFMVGLSVGINMKSTNINTGDTYEYYDQQFDDDFTLEPFEN